MAADRRRRPTAAAAGLILLAGAGLAGLAVLRLPGETAAGAAPAATAPAPPVRRVEIDPELTSRVRACIGAALDAASRETKGRVGPRSASVAVHVRELGAEGELVSLLADRSMRPASNLKLVTSSAALVLLGPAFHFETVLETEGSVSGGVLRGDLVARAAADPLYERDGDGSVEALLEPAVQAVAAQGIHRVEGALVLDELDFQAPEPAPGWPDASQHWNEFCALAGGFSANAGCLTATVVPGEVGAAARVRVEPRSGGLPRKGRVVTGPRGSRLDVRVEGRHGSAWVDGSIPAGVPEYRARFAAGDPVALFGQALAGSLSDHGIALRDGFRRAHAPLAGRWTELARIRTPIADVLEAVNQDSNNACADQLFLALGHAHGGAGTRAGGRAAVALALERLGVSSEGLVAVDGSGLSRDNRVSARQITALLSAVLSLDRPTAEAFLASLAVGGESGTLDSRMTDPALAGNVHAKTGFIAGTSALSGVLDAPSGRRLVFSILVEYPAAGGLNRSCWKPMQDAICGELARTDG